MISMERVNSIEVVIQIFIKVPKGDPDSNNYIHSWQVFLRWTPDGATSIDYKFGHPMAPIALVPNLTTRCHHLHWLPI